MKAKPQGRKKALSMRKSEVKPFGSINKLYESQSSLGMHTPVKDSDDHSDLSDNVRRTTTSKKSAYKSHRESIDPKKDLQLLQ